MAQKPHTTKKAELEQRGLVVMFFSLIAYGSVPQLLMLIAETEAVLFTEWERMPWRSRILLGEVTRRPEVVQMRWDAMNPQVQAEFIGRVRAAARRAVEALAAANDDIRREVEQIGGRAFLRSAA